MLWETERSLSDKSSEIWAQFSGLPLTVFFYEATRRLGGCFLSCKMGIKPVQPKPCFEKQSSLNKNISILFFFKKRAPALRSLQFGFRKREHKRRKQVDGGNACLLQASHPDRSCGRACGQLPQDSGCRTPGTPSEGLPPQ